VSVRTEELIAEYRRRFFSQGVLMVGPIPRPGGGGYDVQYVRPELPPVGRVRGGSGETPVEAAAAAWAEFSRHPFTELHELKAS
jgi:hypothetical protein